MAPRGGRMTVAAALAAAALATAGSVPAASGEGLTLRAAVDQALKTSPLLVAAARQRQAAEAGIDRARAAFLPRLDGAYGYARSDLPVFAFGSKLNQGQFTDADFAIDRLNDPGAVDNFRAAITLSQPIFTSGRASLGLERAQITSRIADLDVVRTTQEVVFQSARSYYGLRLAQERLAAVDQAMRAAEANERLASARVRSGLAVESDLLSAQVRLARLQEQVLTARGQVEIAQATLNDAIGASLDAPVEAIEPLTLDAVPPEEPLTAALDRRPDYRASRLQEEARDRDTRLARAEFFPTVGLEGTYEMNAANPTSDGQGAWAVMAVLRWNFLAGGADRAKLREAEAAQERAKALTTRHASQVGVEVKTARTHLESARARVAVAERAIAAAEETLRIVRIRYQGGIATIIDLLATEAAATDARVRRSEALHDHSLGRLAWELALGRLGAETFR